MQILGIDPGLTSCGYCVLNVDNWPKITTCGYYCTNNKLPMAERLSQLYNFFVDSVISQHHPHLLAIEDQFVGKNHDVTMKIVMAKTACMVAASNNGVKVIQFKPTSVKYAVTQDGGARKDKIKRKMERLFNTKIQGPDDVSDAIAIAMTAYLSQQQKR